MLRRSRRVLIFSLNVSMFYTISSYSIVLEFDDTIIVYYYFSIVLYCTVPYLIMYYNPMEYNSFLTPIKPMYRLDYTTTANRPIFYSCCHKCKI